MSTNAEHAAVAEVARDVVRPTVTVIVASGSQPRIAAGHPEFLRDAAVRWMALPPTIWSSPRQIAALVRSERADEFAIAVQSLAGARSVGLTAIALLARANHRWLIDESGRRVACRWSTFLLLDLPRLAWMLAVSALIVVLSAAVLWPVRWSLARARRQELP